MASPISKVLDASFKDGAFKKRPNASQKIFFRSSVITAWEILDIIKARSKLGIEGEEVASKMKLHPNTINTFLRWLVEKNLIEFETPKGDHDQPMPPRVYRPKGT